MAQSPEPFGDSLIFPMSDAATDSSSSGLNTASSSSSDLLPSAPEVIVTRSNDLSQEMKKMIRKVFDQYLLASKCSHSANSSRYREFCEEVFEAWNTSLPPNPLPPDLPPRGKNHGVKYVGKYMDVCSKTVSGVFIKLVLGEHSVDYLFTDAEGRQIIVDASAINFEDAKMESDEYRIEVALKAWDEAERNRVLTFNRGRAIALSQRLIIDPADDLRELKLIPLRLLGDYLMKPPPEQMHRRPGKIREILRCFGVMRIREDLNV